MDRTLEEGVIAWAEAVGILAQSAPEQQMQKLLEEVHELQEGISGAEPKDIAHISQEIGDVAVVLCILSQMHNTSLSVCLEGALSKIRKRKGKMIDGVFVKEADLPLPIPLQSKNKP